MAGSIRGPGTGCQPLSAGQVDDGSRRCWLPRWPCELCGDPAGRAGICAPCREDLPWIGPACPACARPEPTPGPCGECGERPPLWGRAIVPWAWAFPIDALITRFKYGGALHYGALLGRLLAEACRNSRPDGLVPVPLHEARLAERGFNQAHELARPVHRALRVPILADLCARRFSTPPQAGLGALQRYRNLDEAFAVGGEARGLWLAIIDDVLTTGSTARALASALLDAGAVSVEVWAVARGGTAHAGTNV
jgi:ComF family protein